MVRLFLGVCFAALLAGCAASSSLEAPPADLQHAKSTNEVGGGGY